MYGKTLEISFWAYISQKPFYGLEDSGALFSGEIISWVKKKFEICWNYEQGKK